MTGLLVEKRQDSSIPYKPLQTHWHNE